MDDNQEETNNEVDSASENIDVNSPESTKDHKPFYIIAGGVLSGCVALAVAYAYVNTARTTPEVVIEVPKEIEENENRPAPGLPPVPQDNTEINPEESSPTTTVKKEFHFSFTEDPTDYSIYYSQLVEQEGIVWLEKPESMGDLELFSYGDLYWSKNKIHEYWKLAEINGEPLLFVLVPCDGMMCSNYNMVFVGSEENGYKLLTQHSSYEYLLENYSGMRLAENVTLDEEFVVEAHALDETLNIEGVELKFGGRFGELRELGFFANTNFNPSRVAPEMTYASEFVTDTKYGPLFRGKRETWEGLTADMDYAIRLPGGLSAPLSHQPEFIWDDRVPRIGWLDGTDNESAYRTDGMNSCGWGGPEIMNENIPDELLLLAGHTINGEPVYKITDKDHPLVTRIFDGETRKYYDYDKATDETGQVEITRNEFIELGGIIIYVDEFGLQHVLTNTKFGPQAECAKPVVYLYPEETTVVEVSLDALITKSDPDYGSGWTATAYPDGRLVVGGKEYEYLFWDGYGNGEYPVFEQGFMVPTSEAMVLMSEHLGTMGFNEQEIVDFVEFWEEYLPEEEYTRFSWIGTHGMENLAKLYVDPKPDTVIRAFVDFEGLDNPITIEPQDIPHYPREGFVVTEWGGLLRE